MISCCLECLIVLTPDTPTVGLGMLCRHHAEDDIEAQRLVCVKDQTLLTANLF